jgi:hypothetical protein
MAIACGLPVFGAAAVAMTPRDVALTHAAAGRAVFPCVWRDGPARKKPITDNGLLDAALDPAKIGSWWDKYPQALIGLPTGRASGFVVLDIDIKFDNANGYDTLDDLGFGILPDTPLVHTASGGLHLWFLPPATELRNTSGARGRGIGAGLDWRGEGGYVIAPSPDSGYSWDPHWNLDTAPLAEVPTGLLPREIEQSEEASPAPIRPQPLSKYAEVALDGAVKAVVDAPVGEQYLTLNMEVYGIARLVAGGVIPAGVAMAGLQWAARQMRSYDPRRPWSQNELDRLVRRSFADGLGNPRVPKEDRR